MHKSSFIVWRPRDRRFLPLLIALIVVFASLISVLYVVFSVVRVAGDSMEPALLSGDRVLLTRGYEHPEAGDVVSFTVLSPHGQPERLIKRVVAVPGDTVQVVGDVVYVNGELSNAAPTARVGTGGDPRLELAVPPGTVYVLGDNRPVALDSRFFGPVSLASIRGAGVAVIWPPTRAGAID